jgi:hypothetical protein
MGPRVLARLMVGLLAALALASLAAVPAAAGDGGNHVIGDVPMLRQQYRLSCEAAALEMALAHEGIRRSQWRTLLAMGIDRRHPGAGYRGGGDPYRGFVGDPSGSEIRRTGYGTYFPPVARVATAFGGRVVLADQRVAPAIVYAQVATGHPAITWIAYDWAPHARHDYLAWDGRWVPYAGPIEHTVTIVGVGPGSVLVNDPARGAYWRSRAAFEAAFAVYDDMAVVLA